MAEGRTVKKWLRFYMSGYELGTNARSLGTAGWSYEESDQTAWQDTAHGYLPNHANISLGPFNGIYDTTATTGLHAVASDPSNIPRDIMVPVGERAIPALGDPTFCARLMQLGYQTDTSGDVVNIPFGPWDVDDLMTPFGQPWGHLLHIKESEAAVNTSDTDNVDSYSGAATSEGGYFMHQIFSITGAGTVTLSVEDSPDQDNANFLPIAGGCTTAAIATAAAPTSGIIRTTVASAAVRRWTRWQIAFGGGATACEFALAFVRGRAS